MEPYQVTASCVKVLFLVWVILINLVIINSFYYLQSNEICNYIRPLLQKSPYTISHVGTNNCVNESPRVVLDKILNLKAFIHISLPQCKIIISNVINRTSNGKASLKGENLNNHLSPLKLEIE